MKRLQDYQPILGKVFDRIINDYDFASSQPLDSVFASNDRVVSILNHSTPLSWLPAVCLLSEKVCASGGGRRIPVGVMDKFFFQFPLFKPIAGYLTQFDVFPTFEDIMRKTRAEYTDVAIFPEGSNCFFGQGEVIQPFRSPRFVELALKMNAKIMIVVHRGSEDWAHAIRLKNMDLPFKAFLPGWLNEKIHQGGFFVVPTLPKKIRCFRMTVEFYEPQLKIEELSKHRAIRMRQLWSEAENVRHRMQFLFDSLA